MVFWVFIADFCVFSTVTERFLAFPTVFEGFYSTEDFISKYLKAYDDENISNITWVSLKQLDAHIFFSIFTLNETLTSFRSHLPWAYCIYMFFFCVLFENQHIWSDFLLLKARKRRQFSHYTQYSGRFEVWLIFINLLKCLKWWKAAFFLEFNEFVRRMKCVNMIHFVAICSCANDLVIQTNSSLIEITNIRRNIKSKRKISKHSTKKKQ